MTDRQPMDPTEAFAELSRIKLSETDVDGVLRKIAELAERTVPGSDEVSVTLVRGKGAYTATYTGDVALALDKVQYELGAGPCLDAAASGDSLSLVDMSTETRWPQFAARALEAGIHSSLSMGMPIQENVGGALNIYAVKPDTLS